MPMNSPTLKWIGTMFTHCSISSLMTFFCWIFFVFAAFDLDGSNILMIKQNPQQVFSFTVTMTVQRRREWGSHWWRAVRKEWLRRCALCCIAPSCCELHEVHIYWSKRGERNAVDRPFSSFHSFHFLFSSQACTDELICVWEQRKQRNILFIPLLLRWLATYWLDGRVV